MSQPSLITQRRPRILQLIKGLGRGGAEVLLDEGLRVAARGKFDYSYAYFLPWKGQLHGSLAEQGVEVRCLRARSAMAILLSIHRVVALLRRWEIDLIHAHLPLAGVAARLAGRWAGVPVVYTEHGPVGHSHAMTRRVNLATWRLQSHVIAVSDEVAESLQHFGASGVPVSVIRNGVVPERFDTDREDVERVREKLGFSEHGPIIGTVAVFRLQKRLDLWLDVARRVLDAQPSASFLIVGDGPLREEIEAKSRALGLGEAVRFVGRHDDVRPFLAVMDVFLMSSDFEGTPVALLEAMAMKRPVVATAVGGVSVVVDHEQNGFLVEPGDTGGLERGVLALLQDTDKGRSFGEAARQKVCRDFSLKDTVRRIESIYHEVLAG